MPLTDYGPVRLVENASGGGGRALTDNFKHLADRLGDLVANVRDYGADPTGAADSTAALQAAVNAASAAVVHVPAGTYSVSSIEVPGSRLYLRLAPGATLVHRAGATQPLLRSSGPVSGVIEGGTWDGNAAATADWLDLIYLTAADLTVRDVAFVRSRRSAVRLTLGGGLVSVERCTFREMAEHGGTLGQQTTAVQLGGSGSAAVRGCYFHADAPSAAGKAPGGLLVSASSMASLWVEGNEFDGIGQDYALNKIGCVDLYFGADRSVVHDNLFKNYRYQACKIQNSGETRVTKNRIFGTDGSLVIEAINVQPAVRSPTQSRRHVTVDDNTIDVGLDVRGIVVQSDPDFPTEVVQITKNTVISARRAIWLNRCAGQARIVGNQIASFGDQGAFLIENCSNEVLVADNQAANGTGIGLFARTGLESADLIVRDNTFRDCAVVGITVWDVRSLRLTGNTFIGTPESVVDVAGSGTYATVANNLAPVGATASLALGGYTKALQYNNSWTLSGLNVFGIVGDARLTGNLRLGTASVLTFINDAGTGATIRTGAGSPEGVVAATVGSLYLRNDGGAGSTLWVKEAGSGNVGWAAK